MKKQSIILALAFAICGFIATFLAFDSVSAISVGSTYTASGTLHGWWSSSYSAHPSLGACGDTCFHLTASISDLGTLNVSDGNGQGWCHCADPGQPNAAVAGEGLYNTTATVTSISNGRIWLSMVFTPVPSPRQRIACQGYIDIPVSLTGIAVDSNGTELGSDKNPGNPDAGQPYWVNPQSTGYGGQVWIRRRWLESEGYTFRGWTFTNTEAGRTSGLYSTDDVIAPYITSDTKVYAVYEHEVTLSGEAYASDGTRLSSIDPASDTVNYGESASITSKSGGSDYTFVGWSTSKPSSGSYSLSSKKDTYSVSALKSDMTVYAIYEHDVTLSGQAYSTDGTRLSSLDPSSSTVDYGSSATINSKDGGSRYTFKGWATSKPTSKSYSIVSYNSSYTVNPLKSDTTVYAVYEASYFKGLSQVTEGNSSTKATSSNTTSTGYSSGGASNTRDVSCSSSGCDITFRHYLKRTQGDKSTQYKITRTINDGSSTETVVSTTTENFSSGSTVNVRTDQTYLETETHNLKPGYKVCEKLSFVPSSLTASYVSTEICALAVGTPIDPDDPAGNGTGVNIEVKNNNVAKYNNYTNDTVYAKPSDKICFKWSYNPALQYTTKLIPDGIVIGSNSYTNSKSKTLQNFYNEKHGSSLQNWNSAFMISYTNFNSVFSPSQNYPQTIGSITPVSETDQCGSGVSSSQAGKTITGTISTNANSSISTTPKNVTYSSGNIATIDTSEAKDTAKAEVPYNFNTEVSVTQNQEIVYAGESDGDSVTPNIKVTKRYNATTEGDYATKVDNAKIQVIFYKGAAKSGNNNWGNASSDLCDYFGGDCYKVLDETNQTLNASGNANGAEESRSPSFNIPDVAAGTTYCLAVAVYPSNSGEDTNMKTSGSDSWNVSDSKCVTVAKRPNFQVWGGNIYSEKTIDVSIAIKNNIADYDEYPFSITGGGTNIAFGSWGELGLITTQSNKWLASGAATGYTDYNGSDLIASPGGKSVNSNDRHASAILASSLSPLTIVNPSSTSNSASVLNYSSSRESFIASFLNGTAKTTLAGEIFGNSGTVVEKVLSGRENTLYTYHKGEDNLDFGNKSLPVVCGTDSEGNSIICNTHVIYSEGNITITDNIEYENRTYASEADIPKFIIYAKGNINIQCSVSNIDAWLISEGDVDTCSNPEDDGDLANAKNATNRSNQLTIFGSIIASNLYLNRTYGAGTGDNSIVPAEIIDYDSTIYYLVDDNSESSTSTSSDNARYNLQEAYVRELPPRY